MLDYVLPIGACFYSLLQLAKDWDNHQTTLRRTAAFVLVLLLGIGSAFNIHLSKSRTSKQHTDDQRQIAELKKAVEVSDQNQKTNTQEFVKGFDALSTRVADLQTQVKTEGLQSKLASVQADLRKTQKALAPGPKADLTFTFIPFKNPAFGAHEKAEPVTETTLPIGPDGVVHVDFTILNLTEAEAVNVDVNVQICDECKYAKEPEGMGKDPAVFNPQTIRLLNVPRLQPLQIWRTISLNITPPPTGAAFSIGFQYRCQTCTLTTEPRLGIVHISGR